MRTEDPNSQRTEGVTDRSSRDNPETPAPGQRNKLNPLLSLMKRGKKEGIVILLLSAAVLLLALALVIMVTGQKRDTTESDVSAPTAIAGLTATITPTAIAVPTAMITPTAATVPTATIAPTATVVPTVIAAPTAITNTSVTITPYETNGFYIRKTEIRLLARKYAVQYSSPKEYYKQVFNARLSAQNLESFAPPVDTQAILLRKMTDSELVFALYYHQNAETTDKVEGKIVLEGFPSGAVENPVFFQGLFSDGIMYFSMDSLIPNASQWVPGNYRFSFWLENSIVYSCSFIIVPNAYSDGT